MNLLYSDSNILLCKIHYTNANIEAIMFSNNAFFSQQCNKRQWLTHNLYWISENKECTCSFTEAKMVVAVVSDSMPGPVEASCVVCGSPSSTIGVCSGAGILPVITIFWNSLHFQPVMFKIDVLGLSILLSFFFQNLFKLN